MNRRGRHRRGLLGLTSLLLVACLPLRAQDAPRPQLRDSSVESGPVAPDATVQLRFVGALGVQDGDYAVLIGKEDVTAQFRVVASDTLEGRFKNAPLPPGATLLRLFQVDANHEWIERFRLPLEVSKPAPKRSSVAPQFVPGFKSQVWEERSPDAAPVTRSEFTDGTLQAGLKTRHQGEGWSLASQSRVLGSSNRAEALEFRARGEDARKLELASFSVDGRARSALGDSRVQLGNVAAGTHPLLDAEVLPQPATSGVAAPRSPGHRGVRLTQQFTPRVALSGAVQSSSRVVGFADAFGVEEEDNRVESVSLSVEALPRAGALRLEATHVDAATKALDSLASSSLTEDERSRGWGVRVTGTSDEEQRLRTELAYASSEHTAGGNAALNIAPGPRLRRDAYLGEITLDLLRDAPVWEQWPVSLSANLRREYADPQYESVAAFFGSDYLQDALTLSANAGPAALQIDAQLREDNVREDASFFKNKGRDLSFNFVLPLGAVFDAEAASPWWPQANALWLRSDNFADRAFLPFGLTRADLPEVLATTAGGGLNWTFSTLGLGYSFTRTTQDDRQPGFEAFDTRDRTHELSLQWQPGAPLALNASFAHARVEQEATGLTQRFITASTGVNWQLDARHALQLNVASSHVEDRSAQTQSRALQAQAQGLRRFSLRAAGTRTQGQMFLRYALSETRFDLDGSTPFDLHPRTQSVQLGLSLSFS